MYLSVLVAARQLQLTVLNFAIYWVYIIHTHSSGHLEVVAISRHFSAAGYGHFLYSCQNQAAIKPSVSEALTGEMNSGTEGEKEEAANAK